MKRIISTYMLDMPIGKMLIGGIENNLCLCDFADGKRHPAVVRTVCRHLYAEVREGVIPVIEQAADELCEYFAGRRREFTVPLLITGTPFQRSVREALLRVPYGATATYLDIAMAAGGSAGYSRAAAQAIASNPLCVFLPCHRIVATGGIGGYRGGLEAKRRLLRLEGVQRERR